MAAINPYLTFNGNCEEAFTFYKSVFGGDFPYIGRYSEMPPTEGKPVSPEEANKIMHVCLPISKETSLMGSDSSDAYGHATIVGNNISVSVNADSKEEAVRIFDGLSAGGRVTMPLEKTFWGAWFGMFTDKFDINWMVNFDEEPQK
ncbi:MAG TPA: VOC family protein [Flavobacterium sp.]|jgi:PhnB protein